MPDGDGALAGSTDSCTTPGSTTGSTIAHRNPAGTRRSTWAELLRRVFAIDVLNCQHCGGARRLIAMITDGLVVRRILEHLQLSSTPPALAQARAPPEPEFAW